MRTCARARRRHARALRRHELARTSTRPGMLRSLELVARARTWGEAARAGAALTPSLSTTAHPMVKRDSDSLGADVSAAGGDAPSKRGGAAGSKRV